MQLDASLEGRFTFHIPFSLVYNKRVTSVFPLGILAFRVGVSHNPNLRGGNVLGLALTPHT
jgi:hypothetical protein